MGTCAICVPLWMFMFINADGVQELSVHHSEFGCAVTRSYHVRLGQAPGECVMADDATSQQYQWMKRTR